MRSGLLVLLAFIVAPACVRSHERPRDGGADVVDAFVPPWVGCSLAGECVLVFPGCCDPCASIPELGDVVAVHASFVEDYRESVCPGGAICPRCASGTNPNLQPMCERDRCIVVDVRASELSACETSADCVLRDPDCCGCGGGAPIALHRDRTDDYLTRVCNPLLDCVPCDPQPFPEWAAFCDGSGHCIADLIDP